MSESSGITFYIDRCLGNKIIVETLREAYISVEIHDEHFAKDAPDTEWIPEVGKKGWIVLTKDARISKNQLERLAIANAKVKMFILTSQNLSGQDMANIFLLAIPNMRELIRINSAPFIAKIYKNGSVKIWKDAEDLLSELDGFYN
jgi:predicted nuclease of predicted toxin-antitoxin system